MAAVTRRTGGRRPSRSCRTFGTPPTTPTVTATAARPPRRCSTPSSSHERRPSGRRGPAAYSRRPRTAPKVARSVRYVRLDNDVDDVIELMSGSRHRRTSMEASSPTVRPSRLRRHAGWPRAPRRPRRQPSCHPREAASRSAGPSRRLWLSLPRCAWSLPGSPRQHAADVGRAFSAWRDL
jgi:hypothetical protein